MRGIGEVVMSTLRTLFPPKEAPPHDTRHTDSVMRESKYWRARAAALVAQARAEGRSTDYGLRRTDQGA